MDQALKSLHDNRAENPLVSFAVIAYNQQSYIRQAVEGAFAQTYSPLEIILSDDCSTDRTFEIMQEMAAAYSGPHLVKVRQTQANMGVFPHVTQVAKIAGGEFVILAAGDDISNEERVSRLIRAMREDGSWGAYSKYDEIDSVGNAVKLDTRNESLLSLDHPLRSYFFLDDGRVDIVHGATSAYDRRIFDYLEVADCEAILSEDGALTLLLNLLNKRISFVDESLVSYRIHADSLTNGPKNTRYLSVSRIMHDASKGDAYSKSCSNRASMLMQVNDRLADAGKRAVNLDRIREDIYLFDLKSRWADYSFPARIRTVGKMWRANGPEWVLPRIFGKTFFVYLKYVVNVIKVAMLKARKGMAGMIGKAGLPSDGA